MGKITEVLYRPEDINWRARDYMKAYERVPETSKAATYFQKEVPAISWSAVVFAFVMGGLAAMTILKLV